MPSICYNFDMILLTAGTGFISGVMRKQLEKLGMSYRLLVSTSQNINYLTEGMSINIAVSSPHDERGLRAALKDIEVIYHLAGVERIGGEEGLQEKEVKEIDILVKVSKDMGVKRFFYLSHLGADRASAFGMMKAKGIAENIIINSGIDYTILRTGLVYGPGDEFTQNLAKLIRMSPLLILVPGEGKMLVQPIWVNDLVTSLLWSLDLQESKNRVIEVGGPEQLSFYEVVETVARAIHKKPKILPSNMIYLGILTQFLQGMKKKFPINTLWFDYLAENRVADLDSMPRHFGINPARFGQNLNYLKKDKT